MTDLEAFMQWASPEDRAFVENVLRELRDRGVEVNREVEFTVSALAGALAKAAAGSRSSLAHAKLIAERLGLRAFLGLSPLTDDDERAFMFGIE